MARAIDGEELLGITRLLDTDVVRQSKTASWLLDQVLHDIQAMPTLTPPNEPERAGLYGKYTVYKNKDGSLVTDCFILRPAKDPAAVAALRAYAAATDNAELAADIINWVGAEPNEPLPVLINDEPDREYIDYICPRCKDIISQRRRGQRMETVYQCKFHDNCGQRVDWSDPRPYRRPPEGEA